MNLIKPNNNSSRRSTQRLMAILAHPDDEALGFGGVLTHYAHKGFDNPL